jgi:hypothetical protein
MESTRAAPDEEVVPMANTPRGCCRDQSDRWFNRARWISPLYAAYRFVREFAGL